jgi:microcystin-dependent protein
MSFKRPKARILERTITAGNGPFQLAGAVDGSYNRFGAFMAIGDKTYASIVEPGVAAWTGIVTYSATDEITLTTVEEMIGAFGSGTKEVFAGPLASQPIFREDIGGAIQTGGASNAYTVASFCKYDTLAQLNGNIIAFTPHIGNGAVVTLNVDGTGAKPLRLSPGVDLQSNVLIQGTPYTALYSGADQVYYLHAMGGNAYGIPIAASMDYWGDTTPSSAFAFPAGQTLLRSAFPQLYDKIGTRYGNGSGDGLTFSLPDKSGAVSAARDNLGGTARGYLTGATVSPNGNTLGASGGTQQVTLDIAHVPEITPTGEISVILFGGSSQVPRVVRSTGAIIDKAAEAGGTPVYRAQDLATLDTAGSTFTGDSFGGGAAHSNIQRTIVCNHIMRVL